MKAKIIFLVFFISFVSCNKNESLIENNYEGKNHITSNFKLSEVELFAKNENSELRLKNITSNNLSYDGYSQSWTFKYATGIDSTFASKYYYINSQFDKIECDSIVVRERIVGDAFISKNWLNSDKIMEIAENKGGGDFRKNNSEYNISATLNEYFISDDYKPIWTAIYSSTENKYFIIRIDAISGNVVQ